MNNVLHNEVVKIIEIALSQEETSPFLQSVNPYFILVDQRRGFIEILDR